jgi:three-Cys-motif partner protein
MAKNIHEKPFEESTRTKLELFRRYIRAWLPVFIQQKAPLIEIYDFFAGSGTDSIGCPGSPLLILEEITAHCSKLREQNSSIEVLCNDIDRNKITNLKSNIHEKLKACAFENRYPFCDRNDPLTQCPITLRFCASDFTELFTEMYSRMFGARNPRLVFIDQYGIKYVTQSVFKQFTQLQRTDFMFFVSSSHIRRFLQLQEFKNYLNANQINFEGSTPYQTHRIVFNYYKSLIPNGSKYYLGQFALKKNSNIYGVVFGSQHPLGLKKFLDVAWELDKHTGETNFDIDSDSIRTGQTSLDLFGDGSGNKVKKLVAYEEDLLEFLRHGRTNLEIYLFSIENGISIKKTNEALKAFEKKNLLKFEGEDRRKGAYYLDFEPTKQIKIYSI